MKTSVAGPSLPKWLGSVASWGRSATKVDPEAVCSWNGLAAADRVELSLRAKNRFWSSQRALLQFSFCSLLQARQFHWPRAH